MEGKLNGFLLQKLSALERPRSRSVPATRRPRYWIAQRATAQLVPDASHVQFGSRVTLESDDGRKETYRIVGIDKANPKRGTLSYAQALIDREVGDTIEAGGIRREIIKIS